MGHERKALNELEIDVNQHHLRLEDKSVWLFLATLGCWSVDNSYLQLVAYFITLVLFAKTISVGWKSNASFPKRLKQVRKQAQEISDDSDYKKSLLWDCHILGQRLSLMGLLLSTPNYVSIGFFYLASLLVSLQDFVHG